MNRVCLLNRSCSLRYSLFLPLAYLLFSPAVMAEECAEIMATVTSAQGIVEKRQKSGTTWKNVVAQDTFCADDMVRTQLNSRAALYLNNNSILRLNELSAVTFTRSPSQGTSQLDLKKGIAHFISRIKQRFEVLTPYVNAAVDGTEFVVAVDAGYSKVTVLEGRVRVSNEQGEIRLTQGETAQARAGEAPALQTRVQPWDAVSWALYYPAVSDFSALVTAAEELPDPWRSRLLQSFERYKQGQISAALTEIESLPGDLPNGNIYIYRAALYLAAGQAGHASIDLDHALKRDASQDTRNGEALALKAIIAVTQNRTESALKLARDATDASPKIAATWLAQSYAQQAVFDLEQARLSVKQAVKLAPENALAWARLAELHLMFGELDHALQAAHRATEIAPRLARTQSVLGFAYLTRIKVAAAEQAFNQAIELDQAAPLPRLGLGLAMIRRGELASGRHQIEIAASLAPANPLIRSYLGKAYYEEKRDFLAADQLAMAKELDPKDPTPWFYDAIRKQTENDPVSALEDLNKSIELNDNRAVYRSSLLLDQDQAMRSVSLASIYNELGIDQFALTEASNSLSLDPSNHSAHRFLADSYAARPRHEIARVSELLQAQLLQPVNLNSVQPRLSVSDLNIVSGMGFGGTANNEFTQLFERNGVRALGSAIAGNNSTIGDEIVVSGIHNRWSFSFGQLYTETDGFRENNDIENDIYNFFSQVAITNELNVQAEYIRRETEQGDLSFNFDLDDFSTENRRSIEQDIARIGAHWAQSEDSDILFSLVYASITDKSHFAGDEFESSVKDNGYQYELQHLLKYKDFNFTSGLGVYDLNVEDKDQNFGIDENFDQDQKNAYLYTDARINNDAIVTLGLSYDEYQEDQYKVDRYNPKIGLQWDFMKKIRLRAARFKTVKRALAVDRTLEKTSIAGFNQFFDDINGTEAEFYGAAIDANVSQDVYLGINVSRRKLDVPLNKGDIFDDYRENIYRSYFHWVFHDNLTFGIELQYEKFEIKQTDLFELFDGRPQKIETLSLPVAVRYYHHPRGFFYELAGTHYNQDVIRNPGFTSGSDKFILYDAVLGYRFKKYRGFFRLEIRNIGDKNFQFQDNNFRTSEIRASTIIPARTWLGNLTLYF